MRINKYILFAIIGITFGSCSEDFLNPLPDSAVVVQTFFSSDEEVLAGIYGIYDAMQGVNENTVTNDMNANRGVQLEYLLTEHRSDNTRSATLEGSRADFHRYLTDPDNSQSEDYYQSMYDIINRANNVLNYIDVALESNRSKYTAEAKFCRAYAYFNLVRLYGDVPLVTEVVGPSENVALFTRTASATIYTQIEADLTEAAGALDNSSKSRASKAAAQGLLAKSYLTRANRNYAGAVQLCEAIIGSDEFSLMEDFSDVFYSELNDEIMFAVEYLPVNALESQSFSSEFTSAVRQGRQDGLNILMPNLIAHFSAFGGDRTNISYVTIGTSNEVAKFLPAGTDLTATPPTYGDNARDAGNDWIVLRYADVLLMHVEAVMGESSTTSDGDAIDSFMEVKVRAGYDAVTDRPSAVSKDDLLAERRVELAFENQRFYDLVRFGVADAVLSAHASDNGFGAYNERKLLLPIPAREINLSDGLLTQNPGY